MVVGASFAPEGAGFGPPPQPTVNMASAINMQIQEKLRIVRPFSKRGTRTQLTKRGTTFPDIQPGRISLLGEVDPRLSPDIPWNPEKISFQRRERKICPARAKNIENSVGPDVSIPFPAASIGRFSSGIRE
jgi:hypothetical protein